MKINESPNVLRCPNDTNIPNIHVIRTVILIPFITSLSTNNSKNKHMYRQQLLTRDAKFTLAVSQLARLSQPVFL